jgi:hypothetical protein
VVVPQRGPPLLAVGLTRLILRDNMNYRLFPSNGLGRLSPEPHPVVADWRADGLAVCMSTQFTAGVRNELASAFGLPRSRVRVVVDATASALGCQFLGGLWSDHCKPANGSSAIWAGVCWRSDERMVSGAFGPVSESPPFPGTGNA